MPFREIALKGARRKDEERVSCGDRNRWLERRIEGKEGGERRTVTVMISGG